MLYKFRFSSILISKNSPKYFMADIKIYSLVYWMRKGLAMDVSVIVGGIIPQSTGKAEALHPHFLETSLHIDLTTST